MHNNNNCQCKMCWEQTFALVRYNSVFVPLYSLNTCKGVFNPNVTTFQSNCAEGLHFSAFHLESTYLALKLLLIKSIRDYLGRLEIIKFPRDPPDLLS